MLDTGLLYRAVGMKVLGRAASDRTIRPAGSVGPRWIRPWRTGGGPAPPARPPAAVAIYRPSGPGAADFQRKFAAQAAGAVLDGRDIGTVIAPTPR
jgi:cytidylate kinase